MFFVQIDDIDLTNELFFVVLVSQQVWNILIPF